MVAALNYFAVFQNENHIRIVNRRQPVGNHEHCPAFH